MDKPAAHPLFDAPTAAADNRRFAVAALAALCLHLGALAIGIYAPTPTQMGEETGSPEGLTVEIVDPSEIPGANAPAPSVSAEPPSAPVEPAPPADEATPAVAEPQPAEPLTAEPLTAEPATVEPPAPDAPSPEANPTAPDLKPATLDDAAAPPPPPPSAAATTATVKPPASAAARLDTTDPNLFKIQPRTLENPAAKPAPAKTAKPAKPDRPEKFSPAVPAPSFSSNEQMPGRSAGVSRPEGITRSGLNDEFGRGVIRALRQTMPPPNGQRIARATVAFVLTPDGNLADVQLVASSGDPILDRNIVFAVKQSNFPIPATNLTALDRQFRVTYIYR